MYYFTQNINKPLVSYGSNQSNAMFSLSALAKLKQVDFYYMVSHLPEYLKNEPQGNYAKALENGMHLSICENPQQKAMEFAKDNNGIYIPEGGAYADAQLGLKALAHEIDALGCVDIFLPSGTGTTALFLQKYSSNKVYTTPCVGDETYLKKQFFELESDENNHPFILNSEKKYHFGKLYKEFYEIWLQLRKNVDVAFDLLYDPKGWLVLQSHLSTFQNPVLYLHQGGLAGNESMLKRYKRKYDET